MKNKENAFSEFWEMIQKSWTYARLTADERTRVHEALTDAKLLGTFRQRFEQLYNVYGAFLLALDYKPIGWRETDPEVPLF